MHWVLWVPMFRQTQMLPQLASCSYQLSYNPFQLRCIGINLSKPHRLADPGNIEKRWEKKHLSQLQVVLHLSLGFTI